MKQKVAEHFSYIKKSLLGSYLFEFSEPIFESESQEYFACKFTVNAQNIVYRKAKITPTKLGQFVTLWKRDLDGPIQPLHVDDSLDVVIVTTIKGHHVGHFIFPKSILVAKKIISSTHKDGKRGFRVYPPWDETKSKQAKNTQEWQLNYFLRINKPLDIGKTSSLFGLIS